VFVFQCNFTKGCRSNEANKTSRLFDTHDVQPRDNLAYSGLTLYLKDKLESHIFSDVK
jgi:hypothetical protein